jgi:hypothetical protein
MFVGGIVIDDGMDQLSFGNLGFDGGEEADELLMPVACHAAAGHLAWPTSRTSFRVISMWRGDNIATLDATSTVWVVNRGGVR